MLQGLLRVGVDGIVGRNTLTAAASCNQRELASFMLLERERWYRGLVAKKPKSAAFLRGWLNRTSDCPGAGRTAGRAVGDCGMNRRAVLAGALCLFAIGLGVYVLTLRTERDTARTEAQEARQDAATWKAAAQSGEAAVRELAAAKATAEAAAAERDATIKALTRDRGRTAAQAAGGDAA